MLVIRLYRRLLRTPLLVLLMLSMVISPTLAGVGELHDMEHAAESASDAAHGHTHADTDHHQHDGGQPDPDHASGVHGLLHQAGSVPVALPEMAPQVTAPPMAPPFLPEFARFQLPGDSPTHPFRPPIV